MNTAHNMSTESLKLPIEKRIKEKEDLRKDRLIESSITSSDSEFFIFIERSGMSYHHSFLDILNRFYEPLPYNIIKIDFDNLYESILSAFQQEYSLETSSTYPTLELLEVERIYTLRRRSEVIEFLVDNSFLFTLLHEVYEKVRDYFVESVEVILEVVTDLEAEMHQELGVFIRTNLSPNEAIRCLEKFDDEWWLDTPATALKKLCIDVEFI